MVGRGRCVDLSRGRRFGLLARRGARQMKHTVVAIERR